MRQPSKTAGFTLIEIQIALLVLLLIVGVLMGSIQLAAKTSQATERLSTNNNDLRIISALLKQQITSIVPLKALEDSKTKLLFKGESDELYYVGYLPEHVVVGGPWLIHLYESDNQLWLDYRVFDSTRTIRENLSDDYQQVNLLSSIDAFSVEYYNQKNGNWKSTWTNIDRMPSAIKIQIDQAELTWPELITPIKSYSASKTPFHVLKIN